MISLTIGFVPSSPGLSSTKGVVAGSASLRSNAPFVAGLLPIDILYRAFEQLVVGAQLCRIANEFL